MTTQDNDPFAVSPEAAPPGTPATPPGVLTPGLLSGAVPAAPPPPGTPGAPTAFPNYAPTQPASGIALWAIILTGAYTLVSVVSALLAQGTIDRTKENLRDPDNATIDFTSLLLGTASTGAAVGAYVLLALWMSRVRGNLTAQGRKPGGPPAVEWWGWFIPVANFVLPFLGMRAITKNIVGVARLLAWWLPFAAAFVVSTQATIAQVMAIDPVTGELKDEALFDSIVPLTYASALLITVSWIVLYGIITKTTKEHVPNAQ